MPTVDYGSDISTVPDLDPSYSVITGPRVVAEAVARRLITPRGGLFYDLNYGYDVRQFLNAIITPGLASTISSQCEQEALKDERVLGASVVVIQGPGQLSQLTLNVDLKLQSGPFKFVMTVGQALTNFSLVFPNLA